MKFSELGLLPALDEALARENIIEPTTVQIESAPVLLRGKDAFVCSETGTGKTLAYLLPLFCRIDPTSPGLQVVVVVPTHELAMQILQQAQRLAQNSDLPVRSQALIGAASIKRQKEKLKKKPHLAIGTPGRILELIEMRKLKVHTVKSIVLDEIDRLLLGETLESIGKIVRSTLKDRQLVFVSATEQKEIVGEATSLAPDLVTVRAKSSRINPNIDHLYFVEEDRKKPDLLRKLIHALNPERAIVFVHRNDTAELIADKLIHHKLPTARIHKDCDKFERRKALDEFRSGRARILISSDVSSRGIDIKEVTHIFNLDVPTKSDDYLHRAGRTARAGAHGHSISLMTPQEVRLAERYSRELKIDVKRAHLQYGEIVLEKDSPK
ncbi:MAG: DEAD/DEAH box helicase [Proteobacteria bacterium]|nr:DEAD/DEAH box helicase [Pseudomonadota bacterium]